MEIRPRAIMVVLVAEAPSVLDVDTEFIDCLARHDGRRLNGDDPTKLIAGFPHATAAVGCAAAFQCRMGSSEPGPSDAQDRLFRIGVDHVDGLASDADIGATASALAALSELGGLCISRTVYEEVRFQINLDYDTKRDPRQTAFVCQEIRKKLKDLNLMALSAVKISRNSLVSVRGLYESDESVIRRPLLKS